jgi:hypothetical protein
MTDDLSLLTKNNEWLDWLGEDPARQVREKLESLLDRQVPGSKIEWLKLTNKPHVVTNERSDDKDRTKSIVERAAMAVPFELSVKAPEGEPTGLEGVFTWVTTGLDGERRDRAYIDLGQTLVQAVIKLKTRINAD